MMVNAMEMSGVAGSYKKTCERVLSSLKNNKGSIMAMVLLSSFFYA
jgi:FKBP12-rapamycin complex-associated protein